MFNREKIENLVAFIARQNGIADKDKLAEMVRAEFHLLQNGKVFCCPDFAIRFCSVRRETFSNTVLSLSRLQKYDDVPFFVCLVMPGENRLMLANTTFLRKVSHSSQNLRVDNIRGSFNGSDILREFEGFANEPRNFELLFTLHENYTFPENLARLVEATNQIQPTGQRFTPAGNQTACILRSVERAEEFLRSDDYNTLDDDLGTRVRRVAREIALAARIGNVNLRGRVIELLITAPDDVRNALADALRSGAPLPEIYTSDKLGDYERYFPRFRTATDIKSKMLFLSSNPKGYNIDKLLSFLATERSVYLLYLVGVDENGNISTRLCSMYNAQILGGTVGGRILWAGRNSRGGTQFDGNALESALSCFDPSIDPGAARGFIARCLEL